MTQEMETEIISTPAQNENRSLPENLIIDQFQQGDYEEEVEYVVMQYPELPPEMSINQNESYSIIVSGFRWNIININRELRETSHLSKWEISCFEANGNPRSAQCSFLKSTPMSVRSFDDIFICDI
jgi:hypothetical protein